jgi:hypothetical protein
MGTPAKVRSLGTSGLSYQWKPQRPSRPLLGLTKAPIDIGGDPDRSTAENVGNKFYRNADRKHGRGCTVAQFTEAPVSKPGFASDPHEVTKHVARIEQAAGVRSEDKRTAPVVLPPGAAAWVRNC